MVAGAAFCPSCGKPVALAATGPATRASVAATGLQTNIAGALCYVAGFVTGILFLVLDPYRRDRFVRFHAWQSIFLSVTCLVAYFALGLSLMILPGMLWPLRWLLHSLLGLGFLFLWLLLMYEAYDHQQLKLPGIGDLAAKQM